MGSAIPKMRRMDWFFSWVCVVCQDRRRASSGWEDARAADDDVEEDDEVVLFSLLNGVPVAGEEEG